MVRIAMIGVGGMARHHLRTLTTYEDAQVVAYVDPSDESLARADESYPALAGIPRYSDYRDALAAGGFDAVLICSRHADHYTQVVDCFDAGLHVLCEKPLVMNEEETRAVIEARDRSGKIGLVGYQRRVEPVFLKISERLKSGDLGAVQMIHTNLGQSWKHFTKGTWRQEPEISGGGCMNDSGSHVINTMLWFAGEEPATVSAFIDNRSTLVDIDSVIRFEFPSGAVGSLVVSGAAPHWLEETTLWCEKGALLLRKGELDEHPLGGEPVEHRDLTSPWDTIGRHFLDAISKGEPIQSTFEQARAVMRTTQAAYRSAREGGIPIRVGS